MVSPSNCPFPFLFSGPNNLYLFCFSKQKIKLTLLQKYLGTYFNTKVIFFYGLCKSVLRFILQSYIDSLT